MARKDNLQNDTRHSNRPAAPPSGLQGVERLAYSVRDATKALSVGKTTLYELFKAGVLTPIRIGGRTLVPADQLRRLVTEAQSTINVK